MAILALLIHSAVDFNLQIPANAAMFVVMLALGWVCRYWDPLGSATYRRAVSASPGQTLSEQGRRAAGKSVSSGCPGSLTVRLLDP
jgi:hypothetical protein